MKTTLIKFLQTEMNWNPINISFIEKLGGHDDDDFRIERKEGKGMGGSEGFPGFPQE